ncbi:zinc transporter, ZIP family [Marininema mesophilum]|uniref:Zinc transporter, ZIP family n=1 Tax=Marininema mesophilum TaxID=1048340 RepID=A0A1H2TAP0_9BACL|nr:ZIP family metal transporter [Marininema mesophilum]SDW40827.1 zinc transporter, ZIP family [Marininema mesophilum]
MTESLWLSTVVGLSAFLGVLAVLIWRNLSERLIAGSLSLSATVMLSVALFDLLPAAVKAQGGFSHLGLGIGAALLTMLGIHRLLDQGEGEDPYARLGGYLAIAIIVHNIPEGAVIGVGYGAESELGITLALAMAIHNIPEGIGLAAPLLAAGRSPMTILGISTVAGGALPLGTWLGGMFLMDSPNSVATGLFFAATTMIWVVIMEVMPRAWRIHPFASFCGIGVGLFLAWGLHLFHH